MLIIGTGGLARDVLTSLEMDARFADKEITLFDNINTDRHLLYERYRILHTFEEIKGHFANKGNSFLVCIGNPLKRKRMTEHVEQLGGQLCSYVSNSSVVVHPSTPIGLGSVIEPGVMMSRDVFIGKGVFLNSGTIIGHDVHVHDFVSVGPGARLLGGAVIGEYSYIGCNAVIMPGVKIGVKARIGVGRVVSSDVADNAKLA